MERVIGLADEIKDSAKSVNVFGPSKGAIKQWEELTAGGKHLSDEVAQGTKMYKENKVWIKHAKESGFTIVDIGSDGRKNASAFYNMEKEVISGN